MYIIGRFSSPCHNIGCLVVWAVGLSPPSRPLREKVGHKCKSLWKFICDAYTYMGNIDEFTTTVHVESGINIKSHLLEIFDKKKPSCNILFPLECWCHLSKNENSHKLTMVILDQMIGGNMSLALQ